MIRFFRAFGVLLILAGALTVAVYFFPSLGYIWTWFRSISLPIQVGLTVAAIGLTLLMISLISERLKDRASERDLHEDV